MASDRRLCRRLSATFAELLIACEEDRMLREMHHACCARCRCYRETTSSWKLVDRILARTTNQNGTRMAEVTTAL